MADWLDSANSADLDALARCLRDGRLPQPYTQSAVQSAGFKEAAKWFAAMADTPPTTIAVLLERLALERRRADDRYAALAKLVWSGDNEDDQGLRDTAMALDEIFERAEKHVLIATYVIRDGKHLFEALANRLRKRSEIKVDLYVNLLPNETSTDEHVAVGNFLHEFEHKHWPSDVPQPNIYYHPDNLKKGKETVRLHAKCVVADRRWVLVTSANFTEAAQERNIEVGVVLDHPGIAEALVARFTGLRDAHRLRRMGSWG
jgi:phosphatidylserine/phosphatidylglycerophosphate/cardiolipin synthase-like enzyme